MGLLDQAKKDLAAVFGNTGDFSIPLILVKPDKTEINIIGLHTKHHLGVDTDGDTVESRTSHVSFTENQVTDQGESIRNEAGQVDLEAWLVKAKDSTGTLVTYAFQKRFPDETFGLITCILEDYKGG